MTHRHSPPAMTGHGCRTAPAGADPPQRAQSARRGPRAAGNATSAHALRPPRVYRLIRDDIRHTAQNAGGDSRHPKRGDGRRAAESLRSRSGFAACSAWRTRAPSGTRARSSERAAPYAHIRVHPSDTDSRHRALRLAGGSPTGRRVRQAATLRSGKLAVTIPRAVFRPRVSEAPSHHRRFEPCDGWRDEAADRRRGSDRSRATVSFRPPRRADCARWGVSARGGRAGSRPRAVTRAMAFGPSQPHFRPCQVRARMPDVSAWLPRPSPPDRACGSSRRSRAATSAPAADARPPRRAARRAR